MSGPRWQRPGGWALTIYWGFLSVALLEIWLSPATIWGVACIAGMVILLIFLGYKWQTRGNGSKFYWDGFRDRSRGKPCEPPHAFNTKKYREWKDGWTRADEIHKALPPRKL